MSRQKVYAHMKNSVEEARLAVVNAAVNWVTAEETLNSLWDDGQQNYKLESSIEDYYADMVEAVALYKAIIE